jgi:hypothetical protein
MITGHTKDPKRCHACRNHLVQRILGVKQYSVDYRYIGLYAYTLERKCPKWRLRKGKANGHYRREWRVWERQIPKKWQDEEEKLRWYLLRIIPPPILLCENWSG